MTADAAPGLKHSPAPLGMNGVAATVPHWPLMAAAMTAPEAAEQACTPVGVPTVATGVTQKNRYLPTSPATGV